VGLISDEAWADFQAKQQRLASIKCLLEQTKLTTAMLERIATNHAGAADTLVRPAEQDYSSTLGQPLAQLLKRPEVIVEHLVPVLRELAPAFFRRGRSAPSVVDFSSELRNELKSLETEIKYEGYLQQQQRAIERLKKAEQRSIPEWFDYHSVSGLSREMQEKLVKIRPRTLGHASRIPGVTPAAVSLVNVYIEIQARRREHATAI
jgi:tRNA uridine 5-carboxymethylaminomethyl modification enzyme